MNIFRFLVATAVVGTSFALAVDTRSWKHNDREQFEKGTLRNLSLRSDGVLTLAPVFRELADPSLAYLWALAVDSKGTLYTGGGGLGSSTTRITAVDAQGKSRALAEIPGLQVQAIAVDPKDRVYAATSPDGKVYRINADGKAEVFYDPQTKYIWAIAFDSSGNLFVATGDSGEIHRVTPAGQSAVFYRTEETHARSMVIDAKDNLLVGTEPGGLIVRISPAAEGFVLHQTSRREVIAVGVAKDGVIYAAAAGNRGTPGAAPAAPGLTLTPAPAQTSGHQTQSTTAAAKTVQPTPIPVTPPPAPPAPIPGGSEVYRIGTDGYPQRIWSHPQDVVYAIAFDATGRPILGSGNKGNIYRLDSERISTLLIDAAPAQITALVSGPKGRVFAATGNVGKVYAIGPDTASEGSYESDPLDAGSFAYWGRVRQLARGTARVETRSGNLDRPHKNWSEWAELDTEARITSPPARFLQYRVTMASGNATAAPSLREIEVAWMPKNVPPVLEALEITPPNYRFSPPAGLAAQPTPTITLPPLGQRRRTLPSLTLDSGSSSQTMQYARGHLGARWVATDPNGDAMIYKVEIRGMGESEWKLLREKVKEKYLSWDSSAWPDGDYQLRVTASDEPDNPPARALTAEFVSEQFTIDNTPPEISDLTGSRSGSTLTLKWSARDSRSVISKAEYSLDGREWVVAEPTTRLSDSPRLDYAVTIPLENGTETTSAVRVTDEYDNTQVGKVVVK